MKIKNESAELIKENATEIYKKVLRGKKPSLKIPLRTLNNVMYNEKDGYFEIKGLIKERTLTVNTIKTFAQTLICLYFLST